MKVVAEIPPETGHAATAEWPSVSSLESRQGAAILSNIIINEKLKLFQINYLARKVNVLIFLLGHIELARELMARMCINVLYGLLAFDCYVVYQYKSKDSFQTMSP